MNSSPLLTDAFSVGVNAALNLFQQQLHFHVSGGLEAHAGEGIVDKSVLSSAGWTVLPLNHALQLGVVQTNSQPGFALIPAIPA